jgi:hypothetical protein
MILQNQSEEEERNTAVMILLNQSEEEETSTSQNIYFPFSYYLQYKVRMVFPSISGTIAFV